MSDPKTLTEMTYKDCSVYPKLWMAATIEWMNEVRKAIAADNRKAGEKSHNPAKLYDAKRGWTDEPRPAPRTAKKTVVEEKLKKKGK